VAFSLGIGLLLSTWAIYFYDVTEMYQIFLTAWMYLTPIIYPEEIIPENLRTFLFTLNPMYHLLRMFREPIYNGTIPDLRELIGTIGMSILVLAAGWIIFARRSDEFAYRV
jgi:ABC-2 type transport system permease protein